MGLRGLRPCVPPRRQAARGPPGDACGIVVAPAGARSGLRPPNTCLTGRVGGVVWGCATAPRVEPCRGATAARNALTKHGARVALGVDMGACPHTPSPLVSSRGGVPLLAVQAVAGRAMPSRGSGGATPCRGAAIGGGRDAGGRQKGEARHCLFLYPPAGGLVIVIHSAHKVVFARAD